MIKEKLARRREVFALAIRQLGLANALRFILFKYTSRRGWGKKDVYFSSPHCKVSMALRPGTSDVAVFEQIFIDLEYACLDFLSSPKWIIDCGANVGYSSAYFLSRFPEARVVAIEPDTGNYEMLVKNTEWASDRIIPIKAGVWSRDAKLRIRHEGTDNYMQWAFFVEETAPGEPYDIDSVSLDSVLAKVGAPKIDLLKVDIEGSEKVVFADGEAAWLNSIENVVVELHGEECDRIVTKTLAPRTKERFQYGELTVFRLNS